MTAVSGWTAPSGGPSVHITDAQVHLWQTVSGGGQPHRPGRFGAAEVLPLMDAASVARAVLVPPPWTDEGNAVAVAAARAYPDRFAVVGLMSSTGPRTLAGWRVEGMLGARVVLDGRYRQPLDAEDGRWFWREAETFDVPVMVYAPSRLGWIDLLAARHPRLRVIVDHLGMTHDAVGGRAIEEALRLLPLARRPNVAVKATALPMHAADGYPFRSMHAVVYRLVEAFGPQRVFWGSDLSRTRCSYRESVAMFVEEMHDLSPHDLEWIMGRGVSTWLRWPRELAVVAP